MTVLITNFGSDNQRLGNLDYDVVILKNYKAIPLSLSVLKEAMNSWVSHFTIMGAPQKKESRSGVPRDNSGVGLEGSAW